MDWMWKTIRGRFIERNVPWERANSSAVIRMVLRERQIEAKDVKLLQRNKGWCLFKKKCGQFNHNSLECVPFLFRDSIIENHLNRFWSKHGRPGKETLLAEQLIWIQEKSMKTSRQCSSLRPNWTVSWVLPVLFVPSHGFFFGALGVLNLKKIISPSSTM